MPVLTKEHINSAAEYLAAVDLFSALSSEERLKLVTAGHQPLFGAGEVIVRQDAEGDSLFVVLTGQVRVVLEPSEQEVAVIPTGGFFGEMSLLTGDRRTATVKAIGDASVLEITAKNFRTLALANPNLIDHILTVVTARRTGLQSARDAAAAVPAPEVKRTLLARVRQFLKLHA